jgi:hypothetical protein
MLCHEFEQRLNAVLDERREPACDGRLRDHAEQCDTCRELLAGQRWLLIGLRSCVTPRLADDFARRVVAGAAHREPLAHSRSSSRLLLAGGVLLTSAAAALVALSLAWYARGGGPALAKSPAASPATRRETPSLPPVRRYGSARGTLALSEAELLLHLRDGMDELAVAYPGTIERIGEVERLAPGIRPLRLSIALLWDTLFRALPGVRDDRPPAPSRPTGAGHFLLESVGLA